MYSISEFNDDKMTNVYFDIELYDKEKDEDKKITLTIDRMLLTKSLKLINKNCDNLIKSKEQIKYELED